MKNATLRIRSRAGRKKNTFTGFRFLIVTCLCMSVLLGWSARSALAEAPSDHGLLAKAAESAMKTTEQDAIQNKREKFDYRLDRAKQFVGRRQYSNALVSVEEALALYPASTAALYLKEKIVTDSNKTREKLRRAALESATEEAMAEIDRGLVLYDTNRVITDGPVRHWGEVIQRSRSLGLGVRVHDWEAELKKKLDQRISFRFKNTTLYRATQYLQDSTNVGIVIDPKAPIGKTSITLTATEITLASALSHICRFADVKWSMADTMIYISDTEVADRPELRTYTVTDLIMPVRDFAANDRPAPWGSNDPGTRERRNGVHMWVEYARRNSTGEEENKNGWSLAKLITNNIARGTWATEDETGGAGANNIQYRNGKMMVFAPANIQKEILKLLESFRRARAIQIMVQARLIDIDRNYLEEIGVDWTGLEGGVNTISYYSEHTPSAGDGSLLPIARGLSARGMSALDEFGNPRATGYPYLDGVIDFQGLPTGFDAVIGEVGPLFRRNPEPTSYWIDLNQDGLEQPNEMYPAKRVGGEWDIGMANVNLLGMTMGDPSTGFTNQGGLMLDLAYLSTFQVRALLHAVEKHRKGNVLQSPRLTCFNGERANIAVTAQVTYLRNITESLPEIGTITDGIVFEVVPYASADRRYVTMEILPTLRQLTRPMRTLLIEIPEILADGEVSWTRTTIQLPEVTVKSIETFASVPDGGTLLLGGLSRATEGEARAGVPILNDIPILKFFFSRWGKTDTRSSLIILVRADILIQGEKEPQVGPAR